MWFTAVVAGAVAADPTPGLLLPSAAPAPAGSGEVSLSAGHGQLLLLGASGLAGGTVRGGWAPSDVVYLDLAAGGAVDWTDGCPGLAFGGFCRPEQTGGLGLAGSVRARWALTDGFALAPVAGAFGILREGVGTVGGAAGVALEGGGRKVRADLTLMVAVGAEVEGSRYSADGVAVVPVGEGGVTFLLGDERRHAVRVGVAELAPTVSWRYEGDRWFVGAGLVGLPVVAGGEHVTVGLRF